jgi:hypothetical protein
MSEIAEEGLVDLDLAGWQDLLDRHPQIFHGMMAGARVALLPADDFDAPGARMVVWEATGDGMRAGHRPFPGFETVDVDLLFVADEESLRRLHDRTNPTPFGDMKRKVRRREILLYVVRPRDCLLERGYEEFLESLGLVFMGACR